MRIALALALVPLVAHAQSTQSVNLLWETNCQNCHGDRGQGGGAGTRTLLTDELFDQKHDRPFFDAIKKGLPEKGMAPFGETLSDKQVWGLVNFIRELQSRERKHADADKSGMVATKHFAYKAEVVAEEGLDTPWSVEFIPSAGDGRKAWDKVVTNRPGFLTIYRAGKLIAKVGTAEGMPPVWNNGQGGLMDITVDPRYTEAGNNWIYLSFSDPRDNGKTAFTKAVRGKLKEADGKWSWTEQQTLFEARPEHYSNSGIHFGSKIVFDPADPDILFFCNGERGSGELAQDLKRPNGKVHRIRRDGSIPKGNPFANDEGKPTVEGGYPTVWSFGHRNPQGLTFDLNGRLFDTEHGPRGGDELNIIMKGRNYGWPIISFGINYNGAPLVTPWSDTAGKAAEGKNFVMPIHRWLPSIAVCGLDVVRSDQYPNWKGDLLAGGLAGNVVDRFKLSSPSADGSAPTIVEREEILHGAGRVRDVMSAPDGWIYVVVNDPHRVIRILPQQK